MLTEKEIEEEFDKTLKEMDQLRNEMDIEYSEINYLEMKRRRAVYLGLPGIDEIKIKSTLVHKKIMDISDKIKEKTRYLDNLDARYEKM